jgi:UDP-N-acetylglucosamine 1-carboxyvinyltransferase
MSVIYKVTGRQVLHGQVVAQGLPGAVVAGMAAALLTSETVTLRNVPHLPALDRLLTELQWLGVAADWTHRHEISIKATEVTPFPLLTTNQLLSRLPLLITAIVLRCGVCRLELHAQDQGGLMQCMDMMRKFGGLVEIQEGLLRLAFPHKYGVAISMVEMEAQTCLSGMLMAVLAEGMTELRGLPNDPQVSALHTMLASMGADVEIDGDVWRCNGGKSLGGTNMTLPSDPMEVGLFALATLVTGGEVVVQGVASITVTGFLSKLRQMGVGYRVGQQELRFWREMDQPWESVSLEAAPYPGIPGSWLPMFLPLLVQANGEASIQGLPGDLQPAVSLMRSMGAEFYFGESGLKIFGPVKLAASTMRVTGQADGLAALVAALSASGTSEIVGMELVEGQFEHLSERLRKLGAKIVRIER